MPTNKLNISPISAFQDNYIWLLSSGSTACAIVDPGDADPVIEVLDEKKLDLKYILLTHHHPDHVGGVNELVDRYSARVFGPADPRVPRVQQVCSEGDIVRLDELGASFTTLEVPAHTRSHIAFYGEGVLFCGDTLFSLGCGRLFEGTADDMQRALDKIAALPVETKIYCAHEYTAANCAFALEIEPENPSLLARATEVKRLRSNGEITLPATLGDELASNPFLRTRQESVIKVVRQFDPAATAGSGVMAAIRAWKDRY